MGKAYRAFRGERIAFFKAEMGAQRRLRSNR